MHLQESHSLNLHRSYIFFLPPPCPAALFANGSPSSTWREAGGISAAVLLPLSPAVGQMQPTASAKRLLPPWTTHLVVWRPNSGCWQARGSAVPSQPHGRQYLWHSGLRAVGVAGTPSRSPGRWAGRLRPSGEGVCSGRSASGINRKRGLAVRFLLCPLSLFNKPRYISKGFSKKCAHLFSQPRGAFLRERSAVRSLGEGEVGGARQGVLHGGQASPVE